MSLIKQLITHKGYNVNSELLKFFQKEGFELRGECFVFCEDMLVDKRLVVHVYHEGRMTCRLEDRFWGKVFYEKDVPFATENAKDVYRKMMFEVGKRMQTFA